MSEHIPDELASQLRRYYAGQHRAEPSPRQTWQGVAAQLAAPTKGRMIVNDTSDSTQDLQPSTAPVTLSERERIQRGANPPRRGFVVSAAGLAAVIVLALLAYTVFSRIPAGHSSYTNVPSVVNSTLNGVSMVSANEGWAVGSAITQTAAQVNAGKSPPTTPLIFHYIGGAWRAVAVSPNLNGAVLATISMRNAHDGWAGGSYESSPARDNGRTDAPIGKPAVLLHYNGTSWQIVNVPNVVNLGIAQFAYDASGDVWALATGGYYNGRVAILHEHAGQWTIVDDRMLGGSIAFGGIGMASATDGWAAISHSTSVAGSDITTTFLHLQNGVWSTANTYQQTRLAGFTMTSARDGWATVTTTKAGDKSATPTALLLHYTNNAWQEAASPITTGDQYYGQPVFADANHGWMPYSRQTSLDGGTVIGLYVFNGSTWRESHLPVKLGITAGSFTSPAEGWFVGYTNNGESLATTGIVGYGFVFAHYHNGQWSETAPSKDGK